MTIQVGPDTFGEQARKKTKRRLNRRYYDGQKRTDAERRRRRESERTDKSEAKEIRHG